MSCHQSPCMKRNAATMEANRRQLPEDRRRAMSDRRDVVLANLRALDTAKFACPRTRAIFQNNQ